MSTAEDKYFKKNDVVNGYTILQTIGQGRYGIVYLAGNDSGEKVIVKQLKNSMIEDTRKKLFYERKILESLDYKGFPRFISTFKDEDREGYILEFMEGRVFHELLRNGITFTRADIYEICEQLLGLLEILHSKNILHRDIRPPNVIVKNNRELVLIDFGLARFEDGKKYVRDVDYWFLADFLIHLHYSTYQGKGDEEKPWYEELDLSEEEINFYKKLMSIEEKYNSIDEIRADLEIMKSHLVSE